MKKILVSVGFICMTFTYFGQDTIKNSEKSNYRFEKIVHLDATPVQSQGFAGTCWSFSGLSFGVGFSFQRFSLDYGFKRMSSSGSYNGIALQLNLNDWKRKK
jgi:hypothetical protein